jgi:hypothetical protein
MVFFLYSLKVPKKMKKISDELLEKREKYLDVVITKLEKLNCLNHLTIKEKIVILLYLTMSLG